MHAIALPMALIALAAAQARVNRLDGQGMILTETKPDRLRGRRDRLPQVARSPERRARE
jgi:hypothetical protein